MPVQTITDANALLLDLDGTLLDIAQRPDAVVVPAELLRTLHRLHDRLGGALAIVTGRPLAEAERLTERGPWPIAAEHGGIIRWPDGSLEQRSQPLSHYQSWQDRLAAAAEGWPGVLVEAKPLGLVVHFRAAPEYAGPIEALMLTLVAETPDEAELLPARMAFELRPRGIGKGNALLTIMRRPPFAGRVPIFVGDDITDEEAIAAAVELGGVGLHVGRNFGGKPARVRAWLAWAVEGEATPAPETDG